MVQGERQLSLKLSRKYGTTVRLLLAEADSREADNLIPAKQEFEATVEHDEDWYNLRPWECGSGDLGFVSERFDPVAVLNESESEVAKLNPWMSECPLLDTVRQFSLPIGDPLRSNPVTNAKRSPPGTGNASLPAKRQRQLHPFELVAQSLEAGPLSVLHRFHRQRIRVLIRYVNAVRGSLTGTLVAFDKHMSKYIQDQADFYHTSV